LIYLILLLLVTSCHGRLKAEKHALEPEDMGLWGDPPEISIVRSGVDFIEVKYPVDENKVHSDQQILYNLLMSGVSIYSGQRSSFTLT
jgi:hypothetical protein